MAMERTETSDLRVSSILETWLTGLPRGSPRPALPGLSDNDAGALRTWIGPLALMLFTPPISLLVWMACAYGEGSILELLAAGPAQWWAWTPVPGFAAVAVVVGWIGLQLLLLELLPGKKFLGPVTPAGVRPEYKLNGISAWAITHAVLVGGWYLGILDVGGLYDIYGEVIVMLTVTAFVFCMFLYWKGRRYPTSPDTVYTGNLIFDFVQGIDLHPRLMGVNLKQLINCRVSMMGWSLVFVACLIAQYERHGMVSTSMMVSVGVLVVYLFKFFWWEGGYFQSLDIMHDRFGYYICWGVLVWVPAVYCLVALWLVDHPIAWHPAVAAAMFLLGVSSIWINYEADRQRQRVRATGGETTVWGKKPDLIRAKYTTADGIEHDGILLVSGWWSVARHFHYVPELLLAMAWTLPAGFTHFLPWFYWIFLFILLMDRSVRDEKRCAKKYGRYWDQYAERVPYRVLPGVF
jgi:7-dehydrocholesterol reductase